ncbi:LacI family transcriptional regulator [Nonomuraea solani]|uniref:LacI family transcriptional regulator n=1 Tax=Nonomuraea solani TaxID=1144553 RepID=A0A1H6EEW9_9ACTN|nr:LacI family DNA-binding transcriptional regulator [Nonomuraea solani]SEG95559.1 LacI family transcriptional regulator [Nonomuraea solani]
MARRGKRGATLQEIAQEIGVSVATVSRVARGVGQVSDDTRRRVLAAIERHDFRPSRLGSGLAKRSHGALGIVFPGLSGPYYSEVIGGFEEEAVRAQLAVVILGTHLLRESDELVRDTAARVDGLAVMGGVLPDDVVDRLRDRGDPVVLLASRPRAGVPTVRVENVSAFDRLTRHLLADHGYDRLAFVGDPGSSPDADYRWQGFTQAHRHAGAGAPAEPVRVGLTQSEGFIAVNRLLAAGPPPRALVCANDETAIGAVLALLDRGHRVPQDVAVTGFDDIPMAGLPVSGLTTVHQPMRELGRETARLLLRDIEGTVPAAVDRVLETQLVIRGSCGCGVA